MSDRITQRQKQFLRQLGHRDFDNLTKSDASVLIDKLLAEEKASDRKFPCPYCKKLFGPRPQRSKKCPNCKKQIFHFTGKFYTEEQADTILQKRWLEESRKDNKETVKEDWREEKLFRKEFGDSVFVGYLIEIGEDCIQSQELDGTIVLIEDAFDTPELLPPYDECRHDSCECSFQAVSAEEVPRDAKIAEWAAPEDQARLKTRAKRSGKSGCAPVLLFAITVILLQSIFFS